MFKSAKTINGKMHIIKANLFWDMMLCRFILGYHVSEELAASVFSAIQKKCGSKKLFLHCNLLFLDCRGDKGSSSLILVGN
jgi:hypothetical protein